MPGSLQNKLLQFEVAPPPSVWDKIQEQLDKEFIPSDAVVASKLENIAIPPPVTAWENIQAELGSTVDEELKGPKVIPIFYRRIAAAAIIAGIIAIGVLYFLNRNEEKILPKELAKKEVITKPKPVPARPQVKQQNLNSDTPQTIIASINTKKLIPVKKSRKQAAETLQPQEEDLQEEYIYETDPEQAPLYELHTVSALQPVSVSAPPLRDKKGQIIMDLSVIGNPSDEYITVTGPNGKQTKISSKFLSCLSYINSNLTATDMDSKGIQCKTQFEEWRKKLLSEAAFIPTANNFFDIFELKDMIQDM